MCGLNASTYKDGVKSWVRCTSGRSCSWSGDVLTGSREPFSFGFDNLMEPRGAERSLLLHGDADLFELQICG